MTVHSPHAWADRLRTELPVLFDLPADTTLLLHGSTPRGIDDAVSDLDVWLFPQADQPSRFIEFRIDHKPGHVQIESRRAFESRLRQCDFPLIFELRHAVVLSDPDGWAGRLLALARRPMREDVRAAWFAHHYIEMRSEHRACDNPIDRNDAAALLQALVPAVAHALRAAMVLDGEPYPYHKWLARAAATTPTGRLIVPHVETIIDLLGQGALRQPGPERSHPINLAVKEIRRHLIAAARGSGMDAPWLDLWYLHLGERDRIRHFTWETR